MKKSTIIILIIVFCCFIPIIPFSLLWAGFTVNSWFIPNPPKPEITYAEFPFALEYEVEGVYHKYEDILVCEYDGIFYSMGTNKKNRKWTAYYKSGNEQITLFENDEVEIYTFSISGPNIVPGGFMGDESLAEYEVDTFPYVLHKDKKTEELGIAYRFKGNEALMEKYNIRLISWKCADPIKNTFK